MGKRESGCVKVKAHTSKIGNTEVIFMYENEARRKGKLWARDEDEEIA